jgi:hypothetical protein
MGFYDLDKDERVKLVDTIYQELLLELQGNTTGHCLRYFSNTDTYIRKAAYLSIGRIYKHIPNLLPEIIPLLETLFNADNAHVRQTVVNAAGEIGIMTFAPVEHLLEKGLFDAHHSVKNAVIGSVKKMGEKNPQPVLAFARKHLHHPDKEIRRQIVHGIELRGRTHPEEVLPLLQELEWEKVPRVRNMIIHVIGQVSYKRGCLEKVIAHLNEWQNRPLVQKAVKEILEVHENYKDFSYKSPAEAEQYIHDNFRP